MQMKINYVDFSKAVARYLNKGWIIWETKGTFAYDSKDELEITFVDFQPATSELQINSHKGVRIKSTSDNWTWSDWHELNGLTLNL